MVNILRSVKSKVVFLERNTHVFLFLFLYYVNYKKLLLQTFFLLCFKTTHRKIHAARKVDIICSKYLIYAEKSNLVLREMLFNRHPPRGEYFKYNILFSMTHTRERNNIHF